MTQTNKPFIDLTMDTKGIAKDSAEDAAPIIQSVHSQSWPKKGGRENSVFGLPEHEMPLLIDLLICDTGHVQLEWDFSALMRQ